MVSSKKIDHDMRSVSTEYEGLVNEIPQKK